VCVFSSQNETRCDVCYRTLKGIAAFSEERANRTAFERARKKQSDADGIKKWQKELIMAYERFSVTKILVMSFAYELMLIPDLYSPGHRHSRCRRAGSHC
jgi:hypothetical protein